MNKSKLKFFIGSILTLNCLITIEKVYAAMRRAPSPSRTSQQSFKTFFSSSEVKSTGKSRKELITFLGKTQNLSQDELRPITENIKSLINSEDYTISPRLQSTLDFMGQTKEGLKSAINLINETHYKKSYNDYREQKGGVAYKRTVYTFEKNTPDDDRKIYVKFGFDKRNDSLEILTYSDNDLLSEGVDPSQDVSKILNDSSFFNVDLLGRVADKAAYIVKEKIGQGKYILPGRTKYGIQQMGYSREEFINIMKSLNKKDYISGPEPIRSDKDNIYHIQNGNVFIFAPHDSKKNKDLYIKFVLRNDAEEIFVLSFHDKEERLYPFFEYLQ